MRSGVALKQDIKFQFRHGFYYAYIFVSLIYIVMLKIMPLGLRKVVLPLVIFSDPAVLGFFFIGGILLLERDQNILENLFVTPMRVWEYFVAKVGSLTLLAVVSSVAITVSGVGVTGVGWGALLVGVVLCSCFFTLFGFVLAVRAKSLNEYIIISPIVAIFCLPMLEFLQVWSTPLFKLMPGWAGLVLIVGAFQGIGLAEMGIAIANLLVWTVLIYWVARRQFDKYIILKIGGGQ